tara:strand:+ start:3663 stop:4259 length:597 start_codon:yes stop_codon:yes gene_type:complete
MKKLILLFTLIASTANAASDKDFTLQDVETYMSSLKNFTAKFEQVVPGEDFSKGTLYIQKPGKFLWSYTMPNPVKIVSNGGLVYFVDEQAGQTTQVPNSGLLFSLLSKEDIKLNTKNLKLVNLKQNNNRVTLDLVAKVEGEEVPVTLIVKKVSDDKLNLSKIISRNQLDQMVVVSLFEQNENAKIDKDIFEVEGVDEF